MCHPERNICVPELSIGCPAEDGRSCATSTLTGDPCPSLGSFLPCTLDATDCSLGCRTCEEGGVWSECTPPCMLGTTENCAGCGDDCNAKVLNASPSCDTSHSLAPRASANANRCDYVGACAPGFADRDGERSNGCESDSVPPAAVSALIASGGDTAVTLDWVFPSDLDLARCIVRRRTDRAPTNNQDGALVGEFQQPEPNSEGLLVDRDLANGITYFYAVFCADLADNWQESVGAGNATSATTAALPPARVADLVASDGEDRSSTLTFTMPAPRVTSCTILRREGIYPSAHNDAAAVTVAGGPFSGASQSQRVVDLGLVNGLAYRYAVFCVNDGVWNDDLVPGENADIALPLDLPPANPIDLTASDGQDGRVQVDFTVPLGPLDACLLLRKTGGLPQSHADAAALQVGGPFNVAGAPVSLTFTLGIVNGTAYYFAVFCVRGTTWNDNVTVGKNADPGTPLAPGVPANPADLVASGADGAVSLTFSTPAVATNCVVRRTQGGYPTGHTSGTQVGAALGPSQQPTLLDPGLVNGTPYFYAVFCNNGAWNDSAVIGVNATSATPTACAAQTTTLSVANVRCSNNSPGSNNVVAAALAVTSGCANTLTSLTMSRDSNSRTLDTDLRNGRLYRDNLPLGFGVEDTLLGSVAAPTAGDVAFSGLTVPLGAGVATYLLYVIDLSPTASRSLFAPAVQAETSFTLTDAGGSQALASTPLVAGVHAIGAPVCNGPPPTTSGLDLGVGTQAVVGVATLQANTTNWNAGSGPESQVGYVWAKVGGDAGVQTMDCDLRTAGNSPAWAGAWDRGGTTQVLHLDTGLPLSWPVASCGGPTLRVFGVNYDPGAGACTGMSQLTSFTGVVAYSYATPTTVDAASRSVFAPPNTNGDFRIQTTYPAGGQLFGCATARYIDLPLGGLFSYAATSAAGAMTTLQVRLIFEAGGWPYTNPANNINRSQNRHLSVPELYLHIP